jgi:hypothetical protein
MSEERKLKPPYASPGHADKLFDLFRRQTPVKIDSKFVVDNDITSMPNAATVVKLAEWLGLINENGDVVTDKIIKLKLVGDERNQYISELIRDSYSDLFARVHIENANKNDIINYFISYFQFGNTQAEYAASLFLHLCNTYGIPLSDELKRKSLLREKITKGTSLKQKKSTMTIGKNDRPSQTTVHSNPPREGKGIEITVRSFGIEANPQTTIVAMTPQELTTKLETEFKAFMEYAKILLLKED